MFLFISDVIGPPFFLVLMFFIIRYTTNLRTNITRINHNLNTNNATKFKAGDQLTENIPIPGGIGRCDSLSSFLFHLLVEKITKKVTSLNLGYRMVNKRIDIVCYADDAAIIVESENDLQSQLSQFFQARHQLNANISTNKTNCTANAKESPRCKFVVEDKPVEQVMQFRYLAAHTYQAPTTPLKT